MIPAISKQAWNDMKKPIDDNKLSKRLRRETGRAIEDFQMIGEGERIMVCVSGGKDSFTLLDILERLRHRAPVSFTLRAVHLDQNQPGFPVDTLREYLETTGIPYDVIDEDTYSIVKRVIPQGKTMCGLCSRLRRGILYRYAREQGMTRIALGHHRDDMIETLFLNMFYGGQLKSMPPKLLSDDRHNVVIRPLAYCRETDITRYAQMRGYPIIPCNLCGSQDHLQRQAIKTMLAGWEKTHPGRMASIFRSLTQVAPSQLADRDLFDFTALDTPAKPHHWLPEGRNVQWGNDTGSPTLEQIL
jgi:tRNA 2-thiocytidine biosynthesis protein TtcA|tara:strand:+ start:2581 stop:3483 length:903 start_codon:yes stop_codon:yes gene_type:complete